MFVRLLATRCLSAYESVGVPISIVSYTAPTEEVESTLAMREAAIDVLNESAKTNTRDLVIVKVWYGSSSRQFILF